MKKYKEGDLPLVVIFGRTNVGKSTLFNTLAEKKQALISDIPGTTRDSNLAVGEWRGRKFELVDTGGFMNFDYLSKKKIQAETIDEMVQKQAGDYIRRADVILFVVDSKDGLLPQDKIMAQILKRITSQRKSVTMLIANKADSQKQRLAIGDFFSLGFKEVYPVSAATGAGTGDMLDEILKHFKEEIKENDEEEEEDYEEEEKEEEQDDDNYDNKEEGEENEEGKKNNDNKKGSSKKKKNKDEEEIIRICLLGKPNVGKSSLLNAMVGYERVLVSAIPHTTREPQSTIFEYNGQIIECVDTAGISRHGHKQNNLEKFSMAKSLASLKKANLALLILDINEPITKQDARLTEEIISKQKGLIIVANKWDTVEERETKKYIAHIHRELPFATYAPIQFVSAKNRSKIDHLFDLITEVYKARHTQLSASQLEWLMKTAVKKHRPTKGHGTKYPRLYEFSQSGVNPPTFVVRIGARESLADTYLRFLENQLRANFGFAGTPISIWVKKGRDVHGAHDS